jgi:hypothetical protein
MRSTPHRVVRLAGFDLDTEGAEVVAQVAAHGASPRRFASRSSLR